MNIRLYPVVADGRLTGFVAADDEISVVLRVLAEEDGNTWWVADVNGQPEYCGQTHVYGDPAPLERVAATALGSRITSAPASSPDGKRSTLSFPSDLGLTGPGRHRAGPTTVPRPARIRALSPRRTSPRTIARRPPHP